MSKFLNKTFSELVLEKGFNRKCLGFYHIDKAFRDGYSFLEGDIDIYNHHGMFKLIKAPLYQDVVDWLREEKRLRISVTPRTSGNSAYEIWKWDSEKVHWVEVSVFNSYKEYYEALDKAIEEALKLIP